MRTCAFRIISSSTQHSATRIVSTRPNASRPLRGRLFPTLALSALAAAGALDTTTTAALAAPKTEIGRAIDPADPLVIVVSLRKQRLTVFDKNGAVVTSPVSSGQPEFPTPTGVFSVIGKEVEHESNIYEGAEMPYMQRLTWTGTAMHAGNLPGYPASHGCIRLPYNFSKKLFEMTQMNTRVIVTRDDITPAPFSHPKLFAPAVDAQAEPAFVAQQVPSKVASLDDAAPAVVLTPIGEGKLPQSAKAKARLAETQRLFDAIKAAETSRNRVWETVKSANREIEQARAALNALYATIEDASGDYAKAKRAKAAAERALDAAMAKSARARTPAAATAAAKAEEAAEAKLLEAATRLDTANEATARAGTGLDAAKARLTDAQTKRRALDDDLKSSNAALKAAQAAHAVAKREDARYQKPVSVFVSRKTQRLYVRQGFEPLLEVPVTIENPDQALGTHVFTVMGVNADRTLHWHAVTVGASSSEDEQPRRKKGVPEAVVTPVAAKALDRIHISAEALDAINERIKPGSSFIISDEGTSQYFGAGTDFTVATR